MLTTVVFIAFYNIDIYQIIIDVYDLFILIFWYFETGSHVTQIGLRLARKQRLALNSDLLAFASQMRALQAHINS